MKNRGQTRPGSGSSNRAIPRLSILIPSYNGLPYVKSVVCGLLEVLDPRDELIVSDGKSDDGTCEWLAKVTHPQLRKVTPDSGKLSMSEHWDWLSTFSKGEWVMFLGQDDFMFQNYSRTLDTLIAAAKRTGTRALVGPRSFMYWPSVNKDARFVVHRNLRLRKKSSRLSRMLAILSVSSYHSLPQMYTSSVISADLVREIRRLQSGKLILGHPQDAYLAASITRIEPSFLQSDVSFSWVGTSDKSAGWAVASEAHSIGKSSRSPQQSMLARSYLSRVARSPLSYPSWAGDFGIGENSIYFWQSVIRVDEQLGYSARSLMRKPLIRLLIAGCFLRANPGSEQFKAKLLNLTAFASHHSISQREVTVIAYIVSSLTAFPLKVVRVFTQSRHGHRRDTSTRHASGPSATELTITLANFYSRPLESEVPGDDELGPPEEL